MANIHCLCLITVGLILITNFIVSAQSDSNNERLTQVKRLGFVDPKSGYVYQVSSYNMTSMTTDSRYRSVIRVSRGHLNENNKPIGDVENIQTINFHPLLVDFDLHCQPTHCYLVAVTSRSKRNIELYAWQRTQFDLVAKKDSFARPHAVKLFNINSAFYIAIAQEQLHLSTVKLTQEYEEPTRFIGCAILKFTKGHENQIKYHQFIKLPFDPLNLQHYVSYTHAGPSNFSNRPSENHYLVFSLDSNWHEPGSAQAYSFQWSPLNDYFWPFRLPRGFTIVPNAPSGIPKPSDAPFVRYPMIRFPGDQFHTMNLTQLKPADFREPIEMCFNQLQQVLASREFHARKLIDKSKSLWRTPTPAASGAWPPWMQPQNTGVTNITAQVFVHGNVIVRGSLIESPQITMISNRLPQATSVHQISSLANDHSPAIVENRLRQASYRLRYIRDKLARAVLAPSNGSAGQTIVNSRMSFFGNIHAKQIIFRGTGIANSDVRLNGIPFKQLEHELVNLRGSQDIAPRVIFAGHVVADLLEIHGLVNGEYYIRDAIDITSPYVQVLTGRPNHAIIRPASVYRFNSVASADFVLARNATLNGIRLDDFITTDNRPQAIYGRKVFKHLSMGRLDMGNAHALLNGFNISRLATSALYLQGPNGRAYQYISGNHQTFIREVSANRLIFNNIVNRHINMSLLIHDSVKTDDTQLQLISGFKHFQNGLRISQLTTDGAINDVTMNRVFNLNPPPGPNFTDYSTNSSTPQQPITGRFTFAGPISVSGSMNVKLINDIDIDRYAVKRVPVGGGGGGAANQTNGIYPPQIIQGRKIFYRPLRVIDRVGLLTPQMLNSSQAIRPLINNIDIKTINPGISRQMQNPSLIEIDDLEIEGNLNLPTSSNTASGMPRATFGNYSVCPIEVIRSRLVSSGAEEQYLDAPMRVESIRASSVHVEPRGLNGISFPSDFVLRSTRDLSSEMLPDRPIPTEFVFGHKSFEQISVAPPMPIAQQPSYYSSSSASSSSARYISPHGGPVVLVGSYANINNISYGQLQAFINHESQRNSTGDTVLNTLNVYGNIFARRINGYSWPDDILLKSVGSSQGQVPSPYFHRRIYSPLVFLNHSNLVIENQLVLRGPIQLRGRLNGVNLTEFARKSVTYGDKDLLSAGRPLSNKVFAGGLSVNSEVRAQGLIDGVNFDDLKRKAVTIGPAGKTIHMIAPKVFMSDVNFFGPLQILYLNNLPIDHYLKRARFEPSDNLIRIFGKKTVSGALIVNRNLVVQGLINNIDFVELSTKAISIRPGLNDLQFNRTMTIEGNAFMDNLYVDENNGTIDGVKLSDLAPLAVTPAPVQMPTNYPPRQIHYNGRNVTYMRTTPPYATTASYLTSKPRAATFNVPQFNPSLAFRQPMSIRYELPRPVQPVMVPNRSPPVIQQLNLLRNQFTSMNIIHSSREIVIGFIDSSSNDIAALQLPDSEPPYDGSNRVSSNFIQLAQVDYIYPPTIYHIRVGVSTNYNSPNVTQVISSVGSSEQHQITTLPIEAPNNAMFLKYGSKDPRALLLLLSEDETSKTNPWQCVPPGRQMDLYRGQDQSLRRLGGSVHVYLFHVYHNSSSLSSAFFDLYQTLDLPAIDSFESFDYMGSKYALAVSRATETVYLLLLRGYSGFQVVSTIQTPGLEYIRVLYSTDERPSLVIHQTSGLYRLMEAVII